ncbi:hypothetical protein Nepgr_015507 [Nepenthes gracilis]|uniref:Uncharacterized protein n=1 Tax=Nepenthes gracilis TaxID=150966 RepID=A0AAD3XRC6_NEPGR|nr:hypothetical protein Nepgr_015507 [Nepenthes gracilis]
MIKSSLINPDGGSLVDLVVPENERSVKVSEAKSLLRVRLAEINLGWVHVVSEGWASPLRGFMRENECPQSLHFNCLRLEDGSIVDMSLPIALAVDDETEEQIGSSLDVRFAWEDEDRWGILRRRLLEMGCKNPIFLLHPLGGFTKGDDVPLDVWMEQHSKILEDRILDPETTIVAILPSWMHYDEERDLYDPDHGKKGLSMSPGLAKLNILPFWVVAYDIIAKKMVFFDPSRVQDFLIIPANNPRTLVDNLGPINLLIDRKEGFHHHKPNNKPNGSYVIRLEYLSIEPLTSLLPQTRRLCGCKDRYCTLGETLPCSRITGGTDRTLLMDSCVPRAGKYSSDTTRLRNGKK